MLCVSEGQQLFVKLLNAIYPSVYVVENSSAASVGTVEKCTDAMMLYVEAVRLVIYTM